MEKKVSGASIYEANYAHLSLVTSSLFRICAVPQENLRGRCANDVVTSHALKYMVGYPQSSQSPQDLTKHSSPLLPLMVGLGYRRSQFLARSRIPLQMGLLLSSLFLFLCLSFLVDRILFIISYRHSFGTECSRYLLYQCNPGLTDRVYIPPHPILYIIYIASLQQLKFMCDMLSSQVMVASA